MAACLYLMGCEGSKVTQGGDFALSNLNQETQFSDNQLDTLRSTWPIMSRDSGMFGLQVFRYAFLREPKIKFVFPSIRHLSDEEALSSPVLLRHVEKFMTLIGHVIETVDLGPEEVEKHLLVLGAQHGLYEYFREEYFSVYMKSVMDVMEVVLAEEYISEVKETWVALLSYIVRYMREGYHIYLQDHAQEQCPEEAND